MKEKPASSEYNALARAAARYRKTSFVPGVKSHLTAGEVEEMKRRLAGSLGKLQSEIDAQEEIDAIKKLQASRAANESTRAFLLKPDTQGEAEAEPHPPEDAKPDPDL